MIKIKKLIKLILGIVRLYLPSTKKVEKPTVINFQINDFCNSHCVMCNIWKQEKKKELTVPEFEKILKNPLFSEVQYIGITGGEPTLREDLKDFVEVACKNLPKLKGVGNISNAIKTDEVIKRLTEASDVCKRYNKSYNIMISLDGVGKVHDKIRGTKGNFESSLKVIKHFKENTDIQIFTGTTISKRNVWNIDEMLYFLKKNNIYGRFRMAEFINRLYNNDRKKEIRNFSNDEIYHLTIFFKKLELSFEKTPIYKGTYRNIQKMLQGEKRKVKCPYQKNAVSLDAFGNILFCAPKSKILGNTLENSANSLYHDNISYRKSIEEDHCPDCIHDYHAPLKKEEFKLNIQETFWENIILKNLWFFRKLLSTFLKYPIPKIWKTTQGKKIVITGWYGTETVGDKAILGGIIQKLNSKFKEHKIVISSIHPFVTERTLKELGVEATVIPVFSKDFISFCKHADMVIMGGGPLMDMPTLNIPLLAFKCASGEKIIWGCGVGPLREKRFINKVKQIFSLADKVLLRDKKSMQFAKKINPKIKPILDNDPAKVYIENLKVTNQNSKPYLACFLREWTFEYRKNEESQSDFLKKKDEFEKKLAAYIKQTCNKNNLTPAFYSMHNFVVGNDDRDYYREFIQKYFQNTEYIFEERLATIDSTIEAMVSSHKVLAMRFHSVLFASTLETDFMAIDYTRGGKIHAFLDDKKQLNRCINIEKFKY